MHLLLRLIENRIEVWHDRFSLGLFSPQVVKSDEDESMQLKESLLSQDVKLGKLLKLNSACS